MLNFILQKFPTTDVEENKSYQFVNIYVECDNKGRFCLELLYFLQSAPIMNSVVSIVITNEQWCKSVNPESFLWDLGLNIYIRKQRLKMQNIISAEMTNVFLCMYIETSYSTLYLWI